MFKNYLLFCYLPSEAFVYNHNAAMYYGTSLTILGFYSFDST